MNVLRAVVSLCLLLSATVASAQATAECPTLPADSGLQWKEQAENNYLSCKATTADGREVLSLTLTQSDPNIPLSRPLRQEKGTFAGESMYWYLPDLGGQQPPGYADRRMTTVKLDKNKYAQISLYPSDSKELGSLQTLTRGMALGSSAVAAER